MAIKKQTIVEIIKELGRFTAELQDSGEMEWAEKTEQISNDLLVVIEMPEFVDKVTLKRSSYCQRFMRHLFINGAAKGKIWR